MSNLDYDVTEQDLLQFFKDNQFQAVKARILFDQEGNSKCSGFVQLKSEQDAEEAIEFLDQRTLKNRKLNVSMAKSRD